MAELTRQFLSLSEFSKVTGLSPATIRRRVRDGSIQAYQPGGPGKKLLFPPDAMERGAPARTGILDPGADAEHDSDGSVVPLPAPPAASGPRPAWQTMLAMNSVVSGGGN